MSNPIIICGKRGQVASALISILGDEAISFSSADVDFGQYENVARSLEGYAPKAIINAAAYTNVDKAEEEESVAYKANAKLPAALARYCAEKNIPLVHYSTDYVFDGKGINSHKEDEAPCPINAYGRTKLAGEQEIQKSGCKYLIFRTSWVYDYAHKNFLTTMLKLGGTREELSVVSDQIGAPTYAPALSEATLKALDNAQAMQNFPSGVYNLCNAGQTNWHEYAQSIFDMAKNNGMDLKIKNLIAIASSEYPTPAMRPLNSRLDCSKTKSILGVQMPNWQTSLKECMEKVIAGN